MAEDIRFKVHGIVEKGAEGGVQLVPQHGGLKSVHEIATVTLSRARDGASIQDLNVEPNTVVEVITEQGLRFWTNAERLQEIVAPRASRGAVEEGVEIGPDALSRGESRGILGKAILTTLRFFRVEVDVVEEAARLLSKKWEERTVKLAHDGPSARLYRCAQSALGAPAATRQILGDPAVLSAIPITQPILIFLHGTASSTSGSFQELWDQPDLFMQKLFDSYKQQVYALEHKTLSAGPVANAIDLVKSLPNGARLHLVSHSRGGLIGELLCRGGRKEGEPFDADDRKGWNDARGSLEELNHLLQTKNLRVERFVRVACPARGTNLLSQRLDIYLSVLFNLLERAGNKVPLLGQALDIFSELIMAIARERSDPKVLPGLDSMVPDSPLVRLLNRSNVTVSGEMRVIAGDIEGGELGSFFATLLTDPLYLDAHDLVVNTDAMLGGADREGGQAFYFERGPGVSHFRYFVNPSTSSRLLHTLVRAPQAKDESEFEAYSQALAAAALEIKLRRAGEPRHAVIVLPGISGSHLAIGKNRIWADIASLMVGRLADLRVKSAEEADTVSPDGLVAASYSRLCDSLAADFDVIPWAYDWRLSVLKTAELLAKKVEQLLNDPDRKGLPVSFLAHSMGGLVVRAMIGQAPALWEKLSQRTEAPLVMLGTPNAGSYSIMSLLLGRDKLVGKLALLDVGHSKRDLLEIFSGFPGVLELLPSRCFDADEWKRWQITEKDAAAKWVIPESAALKEARETWETIAKSWSDDDLKRMRYVAGRADATPVDIEVREGKIVIVATPNGDGRVPWESTRHPKLQIWYVDAVHGDLADVPEAFPGIADLLRSGKTTKLSQIPPARRGAADRFDLPPEPTPLFPDEADLLRAGLGGGLRRRAASQGPRATVSVMHGNLAFAKHPIMVGHYRGDSLVSAESALDLSLGGRLTRRQRLGLYPGALDTCEVFLDDRANPPGALVIGLGEVGDLNPLSLVKAVTRGAGAYALAVLESRTQIQPSDAPLGVGLSALLIGTGAGALTIMDAVEAILRGVALANDTLAALAGNRVRIESVELIELYADRAIQAAKALGNVGRDTVVRQHFSIEAVPQVNSCAGGRRRAFYDEDPDWWRRLQICESKGLLEFTNLTDRAGVPVHGTHLHHVDRFVQNLTKSTAMDAGTSIALYEMLVPYELKEHARERGNLVLVLDGNAARYPWELMQEKQMGESGSTASHELPIAVESGMVRQLQIPDPRRAGSPLVTSKTAFVVGDPPTHLPELKGARQEAREVHDLLKKLDFTVTTQIRRDDQPATETMDYDILKDLFVGSYRIIHLAGHGQYDRKGAPTPEQGTAGMAIGPRRWLTVDHIKNLRPVPEVVFVNCCYLGSVEEDPNQSPGDFPRLAANLGTALIEIGVRIVVAAGWAVEDEPARTFANTFYEEILHGTTFGDAVRKARAETYQSSPGFNTWGAYQCYGDPSYRMTLRRTSGARTFSFNSWMEPVVELENMVGRIKNAQSSDLLRFSDEISEIESSLAESWLKTGEVCAALGAAYGEIEKFEEAVNQYAKATAAEDGKMTLWAVGQWCNMEAHLAAKIFLELQDREEAKKKIEHAAQRLDTLVALQSTSELRSLQAGIAKRRAMISADLTKKRKFLRVMESGYRNACESSLVPGAKDIDPYSLVNYLAAKVLLRGPERDPKEKAPTVDDLLKKAEQAARERDVQKPEFWNAVTGPDCEVVRALWNGTLTADEDKIIGLYQRALARSGSPRERGSVTEHLAFLRDAVQVWKGKNAAAAQEASQVLERIFAAIRA